jgi:glycosyltransferase involved in cell wall biosynthesis
MLTVPRLEAAVRRSAKPIPVVHFVSAMSGPELWGKERMIATLIDAQLQSEEVLPRLVTFAPCALVEVVAARGVSAKALDGKQLLVPVHAFAELARHLVDGPPALLHTHGYKANLVGRAARGAGVPMRGLVSTCHGWVDETFHTRIYNRIDRFTSYASDVVTVPDPNMLRRFPRGVRRAFVANGVEDRTLASTGERISARARFGFPANRLLVGVLARTDGAKGVLDVVEAARRTAHLPIQWLIAGSGPLEQDIRNARLSNLTFVGYVAESARYLDAIDIYLQASHTEGLSLSLLEAMRAGLPIVATNVGSTALAARPMREAMLVPSAKVAEIIEAVCALMNDRGLASRLGSAARERFESSFTIEHQHYAFLELYASCDRMRT